jgi:hypothetical protein
MTTSNKISIRDGGENSASEVVSRSNRGSLIGKASSEVRLENEYNYYKTNFDELITAKGEPNQNYLQSPSKVDLIDVRIFS